MTKCAHFTFCGKRMAEGDRENGCSDQDAKHCNPTIYVKGRRTRTAPAAPDAPKPLWLRATKSDLP